MVDFYAMEWEIRMRMQSGKSKRMSSDKVEREASYHEREVEWDCL